MNQSHFELNFELIFQKPSSSHFTEPKTVHFPFAAESLQNLDRFLNELRLNSIGQKLFWKNNVQRFKGRPIATTTTAFVVDETNLGIYKHFRIVGERPKLARLFPKNAFGLLLL